MNARAEAVTRLAAYRRLDIPPAGLETTRAALSFYRDRLTALTGAAAADDTGRNSRE